MRCPTIKISMLRDFPHAAMGVNEIFLRRTLIEAGLPTRPGEIQYASVYLRMRQITARFVIPS